VPLYEDLCVFVQMIDLGNWILLVFPSSVHYNLLKTPEIGLKSLNRLNILIIVKKKEKISPHHGTSTNGHQLQGVHNYKSTKKTNLRTSTLALCT